jgi:hypothetical protein
MTDEVCVQYDLFFIQQVLNIMDLGFNDKILQ